MPIPPTNAATDTRRILIVDDELYILDALKRLLKEHEVTTCDSTMDALPLLQQDASFDLVICDMLMPGMDGAELIQRATAANPELRGRFVIMTGGMLSPKTEAFVKAEDVRVLQKPFRVRTLYELIRLRSGA